METCIVCGREIGRNQAVGFIFAGNLEPYPVCRDCMQSSGRELRESQDRAEIPEPDEEYDPGLIEEGL